MIFSSTAYPKSDKRIFYGFKKNGRPFFQNETSYFYSMNSTKENNEIKYESDTLSIKLSDGSEKEYLISTGKVNSYAKIYDFENNEIYKKAMDKFVNDEVFSYHNIGIFLFSNSSGHYYLFGFTINNNNNLKYSVQIHKFNTTKNFNNTNTIEKSIAINDVINEREGISYFITNNQTIICFFLIKGNNRSLNLLI